MAGRAVPVGVTAYRERLTVPWWWHLGTPFFGFLIGGEMLLTTRPAVAVSVIAAVIVLFEGFLLGFGGRLLEVRGGKIRAGGWRLPLDQVRGVALLDPDAMRAELRRRDPRVFRCIAPWLRTGVLLEVDDPDDLPQWLLSTRRPEQLLAVLLDQAHAATQA